MLWLITKDHLFIDGISDHNRMGQRDIMAPEDVQAPYYTHEFQLFDDDGILYYEGICQNPETFDEDECCAPLDWAMNDAGCTTMKYRKRGDTEWKDL